MGLFCWGVSQYFDFKFNMSLKIYQLNQVLISGIIGLMVYYFSGIMMGIPEFRNAKQIILNIIKIKTKEEDEND